MKHALLTIFLYITVLHVGNAQNLVPNPGFEGYYDCPDNTAQIYGPYTSGAHTTVLHWENPTLTTPDYFNGCADNTPVDVPENHLGNFAAHTGKAYIGLTLFYNNSINQHRSEYIQCRLQEPMVQGYKYDVSCYVQIFYHRDTKPSSHTGIYAVDKIDACFSTTRIKSAHVPLKDTTTPLQSFNKTFIADTAKWVRISGVYEAMGGEEWLTLGVFNTISPNALRLQPVSPRTPLTGHMSYYMIDDVFVGEHIPCDTMITSFDTTICTTEMIPLALQSNGNADCNHRWSTGETTPYIHVTQPGTYWCAAVKNCHWFIDTFRITAFYDSLKTTTDTVFCGTGEYLLTATEQATSYLWNTGATTQAITVQQPGKYNCIATRNCLLYMQQYNVKIQPKPEQFITAINDTLLCEGYTISIGNSYKQAASYRWNTGDTNCCISPQNSGEFILQIGTDNCGSFSDTMNIILKDCDNCLFIPSAFTPNMDNINDIFRAIPSCPISKFSMHLYNRWGQEVFTTQNISNGWNGMQGPDNADVGTYYFYIEYNLMHSGEHKHLKGEVILIR